MVSQRQRLARKRYKEAHPEEFPKPEPTPPKDPNKKRKKKSLFKKKKPTSSSGSSSTRHPLRVPGMKPGEGCYICKSKTHIAKLCPEKSEWERNKICLQCRRRGHSLKNCPDKSDESSFEKKLCYNCGDTGHSLSHCPNPLVDGGTKFASCFICKGQGHISKNCPQNKHGVYPMGGSCKVCGSVAHLVKDCPDKLDRDSAPTKRSRFDATPRGKLTKFSGDDLEDDFYEEPQSSKKMKKNSDATAPDDLDQKSIPEKKQGPKANAASGMAVEDECKLKFLELKAKRNYRFIIFRIDGQQVVVEKLGSPEENYDDFSNSLPANECRYAVYDFDFTTNENCQKSKIFFIAWSPDSSRVRMKMVYASSKDRFKRELDGIQVELQATDPSEMSFDIIKSRAL
ncbi:hypothetical protein IGI04_010044 [Brassica rapa subsp. trilocularis]|uniref:Uncharacterized protein n=1 Tax=Brassica rapa subsp. trilocularis TaxID=1813537 RepID=A0ABQ7MZ25_BRACM|nr:hypothetical protein IGI04_010044 [Brassica rapa subsp. trilocularis]